MKIARSIPKIAIILLLLLTLLALLAELFGDLAKGDSSRIVMYIMMAAIFAIGLSNIYGLFRNTQSIQSPQSPQNSQDVHTGKADAEDEDKQEDRQTTPWSQQSRLLFGILIIICLLGWLSLNGIGSSLPDQVQSIARTCVLVILGLPALAVIALTMRNRSRV